VRDSDIPTSEAVDRAAVDPTAVDPTAVGPAAVAGSADLDELDDLDELAGSLSASVAALTRALRRRLRADLVEAPLRGSQAELLRLVYGSPGIGVSAAARALTLADNSVSTLVNQLTTAGLLIREPDPADRRAARLRTTETANKRLRAWERRRAELVTGILAELTAADRAALSAAAPALRRLATLAGGRSGADDDD
jgi:DNA-binding MarR family transcriptional regulator